MIQKPKIAAFLLLCLFFTGLKAQELHTKINNRDVSFNRISDSRTREMLASSMFEGRYYTLLWIDENSSEAGKSALAKDGIELFNKVQPGIYWAAINSSATNRAFSNAGIRGFAPISRVNRIEPALQNPVIDSAFIDADSMVKLDVFYFPGISPQSVKESLEQAGAVGIRFSPVFPMVKCLVNKDQLSILNQIPWAASFTSGNRKMQAYSLVGNKRHGLQMENYLENNRKLTGKGVKVGIWDANSEEHMDLKGRIQIMESRIEGTDHGIHVSGITAGNGLLDPAAKGAAPEAQLYTWNYDGGDGDDQSVQEEMYYAASEQGIALTQNSYGLYNLNGAKIPYLGSDANLDYVANTYPWLLHVFAVGNNRFYFDYNTASTNSKNCIQVANIEADGFLDDYSSFGPTACGSLVPHIAATGVDVYSTSHNNGYVHKTGTSMSAPLISGAVAQMVELYKQKYHTNPQSALLKAVMCNTASDIEQVGPDYHSGYGIYNHVLAMQALDEAHFFESSVNKGEVKLLHVNVPSGTKELRVMLAWNDPWTYPTSGNALVNDLNIIVEKNGVKYNSWVLDPKNPGNAATKGVNTLDNMEQVLISDPEEGLYTIKVIGSGIATSDEDQKQDFVVTYLNVQPELILLTPSYEQVLDESTNIFGETECQIMWLSYGLEGKIDIELSKDGGQSYTKLATVHQDDVYYGLKLDHNFAPDYKIRLKKGGIYSESKTIKYMGIPQLTINANGASSISLSWNKIDGAELYKIYQILNGEIEEMATTSQLSYTIDNLSGDPYYYAVQSVNETYGIESLRCAAKQPDLQMDISQLPFYVDFENGGLEFFEENPAVGTLRTETANGNTSILMAGNSTITPPSYKNDAANRFTLYSNYVQSLTSGYITVPESGKTILGIDVKTQQIKWLFGEIASVVNCYFRVSINGDSIPEISGSYNIGGDDYSLSYPNNIKPEIALVGRFFPFNRLYYDLTPWAGQTIQLKMQGLVPFNSLIQLDNIAIEQAVETDVALIGVKQIPSGVNLAPQAVQVEVANLGTSNLNGFTLSYTIDKGANAFTYTETFSKVLKPFESAWVTFTKKAEFSNENISHFVDIKVIGNDNNLKNNYISIKEIDNYKPQIMLKYNNATNIIDSTTLFTDFGGDRYENYSTAGQMNFIPKDGTKVLKLDFKEFDIKDGDDFRVFSGVFGTDGLIDTALIVRYSKASSAPTTITSTSPSGGFLIHWRKYSSETGSGWKIEVSQVEPPIQVDVNIRTIKSPVTHTNLTKPVPVVVEFWNHGRTPISSLKVYYQIDQSAKVNETINFTTPLVPNARYVHTFSQLADLTTFGKVYTFTVGVDLNGDQIPTSNKVVKSIKNTYPLTSFASAPKIYLWSMDYNGYHYNAPGYISYDQSATELNMVYSKAYTMNIEVWGAWAFYKYNYDVQILIDWNEDGDFNDLGEKLLADVVDLSAASLKAILTAPNNAKPGKKRMRINTLAYASNGTAEQGNETDFTLVLSGTPVQNDVAIVKDNFIAYSEPLVYTPEIDVRQIGATNDSVTVIFTIDDFYTQVSATVIPVNETRTFRFDPVELNNGSYNLTAKVVLASDVAPTDNQRAGKLNIYNFARSFMVQEKGVSYFDFKQPKMNILRQETTNTDSLAYFFGTFARDSFYLFKRYKDSFGQRVEWIAYDTTLSQKSLVYNHGNYFTDILGVAYADEENSFYHLASTTQDKKTYVTKRYNEESKTFTVLDTIKAGEIVLQDLAGLASDTKGNLYTVYKPQSLVCAIEKGTGQLLGLATVPENMADAGDVELEMDKNTGSLMVSVYNRIYSIDPLSRTAKYVNTAPVSIWGLGLRYDEGTAGKLAALRAFRISGQTQPSVISSTNHTIAVEIPWDYDLSHLMVNYITVNGGTVAINGVNVESGVSYIDLSQPATMVINSKSGLNQQVWTITATQRARTELKTFVLTTAKNSGLAEDVTATIENNIITIDLPTSLEPSGLKAKYTLSASSALYWGNERMYSDITALDYSNDMILTVVSNDYVDQINYLVRVNRSVNNLAAINSFELKMADNSGLDKDYPAEIVDTTIYVGFDNTDQSLMAVARYTASAGAKVSSNTGPQESGVSSVELKRGTIYKVVSEDGSLIRSYRINMGTVNKVSDLTGSTIEVYPNPANNNFILSNAVGARVKLYNMAGELVLNTNMVSNGQSIDISRLESGMYIVEVSKGSFVQRVKLVKE